MDAASVPYSVMIIEVRGPGAGTDRVRASLRHLAREVVTGAVGSIRLRQEDLLSVDRQGGVELRIPPSASAARLAGTFADALSRELAVRAGGLAAADSARFLVGLHCAADGSDDPPGAAAELADALAAAKPLVSALQAATRAYLALIVSDETFRLIRDGGSQLVDPAAFLRVPVDAGELGEITGWVTVPGYPTPPGISRADADTSGPKASAGDVTARRQRRVASAQSMPVNFTVQGGQVIHGDQVFGQKIIGADPAEPLA